MSKFIFLDTESSGLDPTRHALLTVGFLAVRDGEVVHEEEVLIKSELLTIDKQAMAVNKIDLEEHNAIAFSRSEARSKLVNLFREHSGSLVVGHKISHDLEFLKHLLTFETFELLRLYRRVDTMDVARFLKECRLLAAPGCGLEVLAKYFGILRHDQEQTHSALNDAHLVRAVYEELKKVVDMPAASFPLPYGGR